MGTNDHGNVKIAKPIAMLIPNAIVADHFPCRLMAPFSRHATRCAPNFGWFSSRDSSAGLLRAKQKAAKIMKGTVGSNGKAMPAVPKARANKPAQR